MDTILNLKPKNVWKHFYALTQIPRPSGHMEKITDFVENFGKSIGLETIRDAAGNVCIRKPATPGYENRQTVILQSHLDMVPQANSNLNFDFTGDAIQAYIDGDWVKAKGTTLGADNGIGVAATMAILEATDLQHGPLEGLFTTDEETGMYGALAVRPGFIEGKIMLNLDSELDGELYIGCAGGEDVSASFRYEKETVAFHKAIVIQVSLTGLKGGHSGVDIHLGRGNANKLIFRFLKDAMLNHNARLISIHGGTLRNAIPREAFATIVVDGEKDYQDVIKLVELYHNTFKTEFDGVEDAIELKAERRVLTPSDPLYLIPHEIQRKLTHAVVSCRNGVVNMFAKIPGTVETSVNMAIIQSDEQSIEVKFLARSSSETKKHAICSTVESAFINADARVTWGNGYPGWNPNPDSAILQIMKKVFEKQRGRTPQVKVMHAGLECGIILSNVPGLDTVSFGPTIQFPHSPDERLEIASVQKFWDFLTGILKEVPRTIKN